MGEKARRRLSAEIKRILAEVLEFEVKDPVLRDSQPTVMGVELSADAQLARVYVYVQAEDRQPVLAALQHDRGFLRSQLAKRLHVRRVPELSFQLDESLDHSLRIEELLGPAQDA